ncbi:MAG: precorrin-2 C(20)-methyltransferase [Bacillota bacterium]
MSKKLYGVGVGPGDPELMTLKAVRILKEVDVIYTPVTKKSRDSKAFRILEKKVACKQKTKKLVFPMIYDRQKLEQAWRKNTEEIMASLSQGKQVAFITIGDPLFYSTYIYLLEKIKGRNSEVDIETIPGITSFQAASARANLPLAQKKERLIVLPEIPDQKETPDILANFSRIIILKVSRDYEKLITFLKENDLTEDFLFVSKCGYPEETIITEIKDLPEEKIDYLSLVICKN